MVKLDWMTKSTIGYGLAAQARASMNVCMRSATIRPAWLVNRRGFCPPTGAQHRSRDTFGWPVSAMVGLQP
jgi:hypothetical protein